MELKSETKYTDTKPSVSIQKNKKNPETGHGFECLSILLTLFCTLHLLKMEMGKTFFTSNFHKNVMK
jgi:hypothetical protein